MFQTSNRVCVIGSFMMDLVAKAPRRPQPGETLRGTDFWITPGGKGYNQAIAASRAGADTVLLGSLGDDDFARSFLATFAAEGIDATRVHIDPKQGTGVGLPVVEPDGQNSIIIIPRSNMSWTPVDVRACADAITAADVVLLQFEVPMDCVLEVARIAKSAGTLVMVNPAPFAKFPAQLLSLTDVLVPNETELQDICGQTDGSKAALTELASNVATKHGITVVVTLGNKGVVTATSDGKTNLITARKVDAIDTVGAGDVFCGNLGAALARGTTLAEAVSHANTAAAISVTRKGGGSSAPTMSETTKLLAENFTHSPGN